MLRPCTKCGVSKPLDSFSRRTSSKDGLNQRCRDCAKSEGKAYRESYDKSLSKSGYVALAREKFMYDHDTDTLLNKDSLTPAGSLRKTGYLYCELNRKKIGLHRVVWMVVHGEYPDQCIDHINGNPGDNKVSNLRHVTHAVNQQNQRGPNSANTSGFMGVSKDGNFFKSSISIDGKLKYLGSFVTPELAHAAYISAKRNLHEGCTI